MRSEMSVLIQDDKRREEVPVVADIERGASPSDGSGRAAETEISVESERAKPRARRILHRVPPQVREKKKHIYEPMFVSLGPYHHDQPHLRRYEEFKDEVLNITLKSNGAVKDDKGLLFRGKILDQVDEIRSFYEGLRMEQYDDKALVEMMLRDACFLLYYMEITVGNTERAKHVMQSIGLLGLSIMANDFSRLENQIPWWVIKLLISLTYDDAINEGRALIRKFLSFLIFGDYDRLERVPWEDGTDKEPLHLLEALRATYLRDEINNSNTNNVVIKCGRLTLCPTFKFGWRRKKKSSRTRLLELLRRPFHSATELKSKGIFFRPSSEFLNDIRFSSHSFHGVLHLPILVVDGGTSTFFSNVIVLEMSPGSTSTDFPVTSYVNFMKALIENSKDVKMLQENGILFSYLEDNEQIVRIFNEIDTHGVDNFYIFENIKTRINAHCNSKAKTWIAELILTKFRTPWTAIAFFAATFLLCVAFLQTYYTMNPRNSGNN